MASTITSAPLTVKITESCTLNGVQQGGTYTKTISGINEISKRIVTATTTLSTVLAFAAEVAAGTYIIANVKYIRLSNLGSVDVTVQINSTAATEAAAFLLGAGESFMLFDIDDAFGAHDSSIGALAADADISAIQLDTASSTANVEILVASS
jgi:hypothetical protein